MKLNATLDVAMTIFLKKISREKQLKKFTPIL